MRYDDDDDEPNVVETPTQETTREGEVQFTFPFNDNISEQLD